MEKKCYRLNEAKMYVDISDGTAIIINSVTGIYFGLNSFGTVVFERILDGAAIEDIAIFVKQVPGVPDNFDDSLGVFVKSLMENEIIIPRDDYSSVTVSIDAEVAEADGFVPICTAYQDVQELLFADPIHEVEEDEGWKPE